MQRTDRKIFNYDDTNISKIYNLSRNLPDETLVKWIKTIKANVKGRINGIIDLGCGTGRFTKYLSNNFKTITYGIDPSINMIKIARQNNIITDFNNVSFNIGKAETLKIQKKVDMVFMSMVYHHIINLKKAFLNIYNVLNKNGYLIIRNATYEDILKNITFDFFPMAREIELQRMPHKKDVISQVLSFRFKLNFVKSIKQVFAFSYNDYYLKLSQRGLSSLRMINDLDFNKGLINLKNYCNQKPKSEKVFENYHLFIFEKI